MVAGAVTGAMSVGTGLPVQVTGNSGVIHNSTLTVHTLMVSPHTWETLMKRKLRTPKPSFLRELQRRKEKESLYVVTEAVETTHDTMLQSLSNAEGAGRPVFLGPGHLKLQGQSHMAKEKAVTITQGTVLAYRVLQLGMREDCWASAYSWAPGEEPNFQGLQRQAGVQLQDLATLPAELRHPLLSALQELLQDPRALQELEDTMEQALDTGVLGQLVGPGGFILSTVRNPSGRLLTSKGRAILCILGAPVVLSDIQHCLLTQSMERRIMPQQLELSEDAALSLSLVESCGLELQGPSQRLMWDPDLVPQLSALYGSLAGLQMLAAPSPVAP
ncbi:gasdermin-C [Callorhinus ursinus]|uniref:gasdermin-C n=1 Tax=Callorhinus ursinus TaxID=34884 RepID=UPI003CD00CAF